MKVVNFLKKIAKKIVFGNKCDQQTFIRFLKAGGAKIGEDVNFFCLENVKLIH